MSKARELHEKAMGYYDEAFLAKRKGDLGSFANSLQKALELEIHAAEQLKDKIDAEPSRSILYRSAASLAIQCKEYELVRELATTALTGKPPLEIRVELENLLKKIDSYEKPSKKSAKKLKTAQEDETLEAVVESSITDSILESVADTIDEGVWLVVSALTDSSIETDKKTSKRGARVGIISSEKPTKTVTIPVERQVKHPIYRKYIKRRKKFMAHDELGAAIGDKVRIVETRPLSAKKRWRVVEIIKKAEK